MTGFGDVQGGIEGGAELSLASLLKLATGEREQACYKVLRH